MLRLSMPARDRDRLLDLLARANRLTDEGELLAAHSAASEALDLALSAKASDAEALALSVVGSLEGIRGAFEPALLKLERAFALADRARNSEVAFTVLLARIPLNLAAKCFEEADLDLRRAKVLVDGLGSGAEGRLLMQEANLLRATNISTDIVESLLLRAIDCFRESGNTDLWESVCLQLARIHANHKKPDMILSVLGPLLSSGGLAVATKIGALTLLGIAYFQQENLGESEAALKKAIDFSQRALWPFGELEPRFLLALQKVLEERWNDAVSLLIPAIQTIEGMRLQIRQDDPRMLFFADWQGIYDLIIMALTKLVLKGETLMTPEMEKPMDPTLLPLLYSDGSKARVFIQQLQVARSTLPPPPVPAEILKEEADMTAEFQRLWALIRGTASLDEPDQKILGNLRRQHTSLNNRFSSFLTRLFEENPQYASTRYNPAFLLLGTGTVGLAKTEALISYKLVAAGVVSVTLTHDGSQLTTFSPISKDRLIVQIDQLRLQIRNHDNGWQNTAAILYKELLSNSLAQISGISRLFIIPDGKLFEIPFELLGTLTPSGFRAVNADYCVAYLPAASLFVHHRSVSPSALDETAPSFLGFGDPIYSESDQRIAGREATPVDMSGVARCRRELERAGLELRRLKGTRIEIEEIARLFKKTGTAKTLCDEHASVEQLRMLDTSNQLIEFRYLHFATHGVLAGELPGLMEPSLVLTLTNPKDDGFLRMSDIMRLKLKADLVVLSACETGLGEQIAGEGVIGMTRAFLYAGAKSIVVSLWQVPDQPTAQLMIKFYRYMLEEGKDKAEALKMAREDMRREFSDPNCWAPFVYYGTA